jgi:protein O-mannosyl-transferase
MLVYGITALFAIISRILLTLTSDFFWIMIKSLLNKNALVIACICVLTFICFSYTRHNQFTNWDDDFYVTNQPYIKALTPHNLKVIFTEDITKNNYHPLCMLSLAINYYFSGLNPVPYYTTNIVIHVLNVLLVFLLALQLCRRLKLNEGGQLFVAAICATLFGIHPMHVESVAWIAERKDVLYAFFYFSGLLCYLEYIDTRSANWLTGTYFLFLLSCLSKPMAVVFPFSMLCLDLLLDRPKDFKLLTEKIIFVLTSLLCGSYAFYTQSRTGAVASFDTLTLAERVMYASYGYVMYVVKIFNPTYLSTFYPYPYRYVDGSLPIIYYAAPLLSVAFITIPLYVAYKRDKFWFRLIAFGICYFTVNVMFVLQFVSVGSAIMADRYSYVAYFGLFFLLAYVVNWLFSNRPALRTGIGIVLGCSLVALSYGCYARTFAWHDAETLLSDAIEKYPYRALLSYKWLGNYYFGKGDYDKALENYEVLTKLRAADQKVYDKIASIYMIRKQFSKADSVLGQGTDIGAGSAGDSYTSKIVYYAEKGDTTNALKNYVAAFKKDRNAERVLSDSCFKFVQQQRYDEAIGGYNTLMVLNTTNAFYYFYRGVAFFGKGNMKKAISDWEMGMKFQSKDVLQSASYDLSVAYDSVGNDSMAVHYITVAQQLGYQGINADFVAKLKGKYEKQKAQRRR